MRRVLPVLLALGAGGSALLTASCMEPPKVGQMEIAVRGLADLHTWDPVMEGKGQYAYDIVMSYGAEILPNLAAHLTDETPTALYDRIVDIRPNVGDICMLLLLNITGLDWKKEFLKDGLFISSQLPNRVFCVRWDPGARQRVQRRVFEIIPPPE